MNGQFYATMQFTDWLDLLTEFEELKDSHEGVEEEKLEEQIAREKFFKEAADYNDGLEETP